MQSRILLVGAVSLLSNLTAAQETRYARRFTDACLVTSAEEGRGHRGHSGQSRPIPKGKE